eukprot:9490282-Pyramimonas_sp.AAC.1
MVTLRSTWGSREPKRTIASPTRLNFGEAVSGPPEASPKMMRGASGEPSPKNPTSHTSFVPATDQSSSVGGAGTSVHDFGSMPLNQNPGSISDCADACATISSDRLYASLPTLVGHVQPRWSMVSGASLQR